MDKGTLQRIVDIRLDEVVKDLVERNRIALNIRGLCCHLWMDFHPTDATKMQCPKCGVTEPRVKMPYG